MCTSVIQMFVFEVKNVNAGDDVHIALSQFNQALIVLLQPSLLHRRGYNEAGV